MQVNNLPDLVNAAVNGQTCRFITFYTDLLNAEETKACVSAVGGYNGFESSAVNQAIDEIVKLDRHVHFVLDREHSIALYVWHSTLPFDQLMTILQRANPDELDPTKEMSFAYSEHGIVRAWWD